MLLVLTACTQTPHIYVISQGYSSEELAPLISELNTLEAQVTVSDAVQIPSEFDETSLAVNPGFHQSQLLNKIENLLSDKGFKRADIYRFAQGKHFYNGNNIGLYVKNPVVVNDYVMPSYIRTQYCNTADGVLQLAKNGDFVYEYELLNSTKNNESESEFSIIKLSGQWQFDQRYLTLEQHETIIQRYHFSQGEKPTFFGPKAADIFTPKLNSTNPALNCELLIIYGE
ncbi:hypothetical protein B1199_19780 [Pseudoalteromonas ulvae]|uniref:Lipoprotein n=2 Tax=Pseudoalteromonas ulvae TaxID=107327 RepID=A0A244CKT9_PSEDV|nr:hypothetical protein B1199_19780 [Pseudoalteromonas ulvae]